MKFGVCFRQALHFKHCSVCFGHSRATNYVSKTLRFFRTRSCVHIEHITVFVLNALLHSKERSVVDSKCRLTHQGVNTNAGFVLFKCTFVFSFVFNCSNANTFALPLYRFSHGVLHLCGHLVIAVLGHRTYNLLHQVHLSMV